MHYYIDGYNVLFRTLGLEDYNLEKQRQLLIEHLQNDIHYLALNVTIVFDAHLRLGERQIIHLLDLKIIFTPTGQNADEYILEMLHLAAEPKRHTIVTSDKGLAWHARSLGAHTMEVTAFMGWLGKHYKNKKKKARTAKTLPKAYEPLNLVTSQPKKEKQPPASTQEKLAAPQGSFDYYLAAFEKNLAASDAQSQTGSLSPKQKAAHERLVKPHKKKPPTHHSDMQRWLKIFEDKDREQKDQL